MEMSITVPDELVLRLRSLGERVSDVLELGLRAWDARGVGYAGLDDVLTTLVTFPTPAEVLALRASPQVQTRISELLEKNRNGGFSPADEDEWHRYMYVEHLVRLAKVKALLIMRTPNSQSK